MGAIWALNLSDLRIISLPFIGVFAIFMGGFLGYLSSKILNLNRKQTGVFIICGSFTNIGSIGSLVTFILLGESAFAMVPFYKLLEGIIYYSIGFPIAKSMSDTISQDESFSQKILNVLTDKYVLVAMSSILAGLLLNIMGFERPSLYSNLNSILIPIGTLLMLSSIGMAIHFGRIFSYLKEAGIIAFIKFLLVPLAVYLLTLFLGLDKVDGGLPVKVSVVLASMPVAFTALVPPTLYDLDLDLANAAWFVTTSMLVLVIPVLSIVIELI
jgi:predicted permease